MDPYMKLYTHTIWDLNIITCTKFEKISFVWYDSVSMSAFQEIHSHNGTLIRLWDCNRIVCTLTYGIIDGIVYLYTIQTKKNFQNLGFATKMMEYFISITHQYDIHANILGGKDNKPCTRLMKCFGFETYDSDTYMIRQKSVIKNKLVTNGSRF